MRIFMHLTQILLAALGLLAAVTASPALAPAARPADCAAKSATVVSMTMRNWDIWHAMSSTAHLKASFTITNPASGDEYRLRNMIFNEDGEWHVCSPLDQGKLLAACEYMMDMSDAKVYFKLSWRCDGYVDESLNPTRTSEPYANPRPGLLCTLRPSASICGRPRTCRCLYRRWSCRQNLRERDKGWQF